MRYLIVIVALVAASGCNPGDVSALSDRAGLEAQKQVDADNENRTRRATEMEADLSVRQRFYEGVRGTYEGTMQTEAGEFKMRVILVPSVPPYRSARVRSLEEIASDLSNLHFNVQIVQWNPSSRMSAVGCRIERVRPDMARGQLDIASETCTNVYSMKLSDGALGDPHIERSDSIASALIDGKQDSVTRMVGQVLPSTTASVYEFSVVRMSR